jgi:DNA-binding SARP family transcriptional activator/tetratricopeptide (TPR) repeat protein
VFGGVKVLVDGEPVLLPGVKAQILLATLMIEHGRLVPVNRIVDIIWADAPPATARALVQTYVSLLRQAFNRRGIHNVITTRAMGYALHLPDGSFDRDEFSRLASAGRVALGDDPASAADLFRAALTLWRGPALAGLRETGLAPAAVGLDEMRIAVIEQAASVELDLGRHVSLLPDLNSWVAEHPTNERLRGHLMTALYRAGRQSEALACFRVGRAVLRDELGLEPTEQLVSLHRAILVNDDDLLQKVSHIRRVDSNPDGRDQHSLGVPAQLPHDPADFTGRRALTTKVLDSTKVRDGRTPMSVITGPGGSGKSAFAVHVAHQLAGTFSDGQLFAELRGMDDVAADPFDVLGRFLRALGADPSLHAETTEERGQQFRSLVAGRRMLFVFDDVADERQVRPLLPGSAGCAVIMTSRHRLSGLAGTSLIELGVLELHEAMDLMGVIAGSARIAAEPAAAREIARYCGFLPLAVRIAGARLASRPQWPVRLLADRLSDERRRLDELVTADLAVRATVALSLRGLPIEAVRGLYLMAYFGVPDFTAPMLGWMLDVPLSTATDLAEILVDARLIEFVGVAAGTVRYRLHDLVRIFSRERAEAIETPAALTAAVARAVGAWLSLVSSIETEVPSGRSRWQYELSTLHPVEEEVLRGVLAAPWSWLEAELEALVAGVERAAAIGLDELAFQVAASRCVAELGVGNRYDVRFRVIDAALTAARLAGKPRAAAILLAELGQLRYDQDRYAEARQMLLEALHEFRESGDDAGVAAVLTDLGASCRESGQLVEALHFLVQARDMWRRIGDDSGIGHSLRLAGSVRLEQGDFSGAESDLADAVIAYRRLGSRRGLAQTLRTIGLVRRAQNRLIEAETVLVEADRIVSELDDRLMMAHTARALAKTWIRMDRLDLALPKAQQSLRTAVGTGDRWGEGSALRVLGEFWLAAGKLAAAEESLRAAIAIWNTLALPLMRARATRDLASVYERRGEVAIAAQMRNEALDVFRDYGSREFQEMQAATAELQNL